jgi:hypothetical protein
MPHGLSRITKGMQTCERATLARRSRGAGMRAVTERPEAMLAFLERGDSHLQVENARTSKVGADA